MATLLLRLAAPLQSWGTESKFDTRNTGREPSKSGIVGLLAAALGYRRHETDKLAELSSLRIGIRVDREGRLLRDFHTAHGEKSAYVTNRYYLADAVFVVGIEGERDRLEEIAYALSHPAFPLFLGRRSCPPTLPLFLGIRDAVLDDALKAEKLWVSKEPRSVRYIFDAASGKRGAAVRDVPLSFDPKLRAYGYRGVTEKFVSGKEEPEHDPFDELEDDYVSFTDKT